MTRISRINAPRATLAAFALLVVFMLGLGVFAEAGHGVATVATTANEVAPEKCAPVLDLLHPCQGV